jgi:hypothetical protein
LRTWLFFKEQLKPLSLSRTWLFLKVTQAFWECDSFWRNCFWATNLNFFVQVQFNLICFVCEFKKKSGKGSNLGPLGYKRDFNHCIIF